ncbi:MAG: hypothetical protein F4Y75_04675 [Acidimicrobiia bacterium]|nr:polysaccharide pyruvyl transferase family protein [bacterium]MXX64174.1 hypothetical protein [Acidimicrobiia bacterium]MCY3580441.1 polysaccharide pyruvyl transferase family protein [bacterium]MCY3651953.1 polysaccharide pyruvyl transferase family protein [bacterium]MDE0644237.1 polysaccharide pyruvyl transferase family protein [bacterium]
MKPRIVVAGWIGSDNLGDELILRSLIRRIRSVGAEPVAISINPETTTRLHGIPAVRHRSPADTLRMSRALEGTTAMIFCGGLIQSETSPWNLPFHYTRVWAGRKTPLGAIGLGVGRVKGLLQKSVARRMIGSMRPPVVRDHGSADRLTAWGFTEVRVGADPVLAEPVEPAEPEDSVCVVLRPPNRRGVGTAASKAAPPSATQAAALASCLEAVAETTGFRIRLVGFQAGRDTAVHQAIANHLTQDVDLVTPNLDNVLDEVGRSRLVITMRYHGAVAALLYGRAAVLLDYSPKMASLAAEGGRWAPLLNPSDLQTDRLVRACQAALEVTGRAGIARESLRSRLTENDRALEELITEKSAKC